MFRATSVASHLPSPLLLLKVPVSRDGIVSPETIQKAIKGSTVLVSIMHSNNEVGGNNRD